jgi:hypothetical protein
MLLEVVETGGEWSSGHGASLTSDYGLGNINIYCEMLQQGYFRLHIF